MSDSPAGLPTERPLRVALPVWTGQWRCISLAWPPHPGVCSNASLDGISVKVFLDEINIQTSRRGGKVITLHSV